MFGHITIYREPFSQNSTVINNKVIHDKNLTYQARFLLIWLLSINPEEEEDVKLTSEKISSETKIPLYKVRSLVKELQDARYIKLGRVREGNRFGCYHWYIFERPIWEDDL